MTNVDHVKLLVFSMSMRSSGLDLGALVMMRLMSETTADGDALGICDVINVALGPLPVVMRLAGLSLSGTARMLEGNMICPSSVLMSH